MSFSIRPITASDETGWRVLWRDYLEFYGTGVSETVTQTTFDRLIEDERVFALVAEEAGELIGLVHCILHPVTWSMELTCCLEDVYVSESARGSGAGRKLIEQVYEEAKKRSCNSVYWHAHENDARVRKLYDKVATLTGFVHYHVVL